MNYAARRILRFFTKKKADTTKLLLGTVFLVLVFLPLLQMFTNVDAVTLESILTSAGFTSAVSNSILSTSISTMISVALACILALFVQRANIRMKALFSAIFVLPMLVPSLAHGMGLIILWGNNGILTNLLGINLSIYGIHGLVLGSVLYAFPVAYLMLADVLKYEDGSPYEAADVLGIPKWRQFIDITLPYLRKPLITVIFSTFTLILTDYGVPLMVGGKFTTLPVIMYQEVIGQLNFGKGAIYGSILLLPAVVAFLIDICNRDKVSDTHIHKPIEPSNAAGLKAIAYGLCISMALFVLLPVLSFVFLSFFKNFPNDLCFTFEHIIRALNLRAGTYLKNSVVIALYTSVIGVCIAGIAAYMTSRMHSKFSRFLHLSVIISATVPGIVLGLSYVLFFKSSFLYGTLAILIMVNVAHFISSPYLLMYNSLNKINSNLEGVAHVLGVSRFYLIRDVLIPMCWKTILEMFSYFFVNSMVTISAVSFLATTVHKPVSLMINQFEAQMQLECAAVVALMILTVNLIVKWLINILKKQDVKKQHLY